MSTSRAWQSDDPAEIAGLLGALFEGTPMGFAVLDRDCRYVHVNSVMASWHGVGAEADVGRTPAEVIPGVEGIEDDLREVMKGGVPVVDARPSGTTGGADGVRHFRASYLPIAARDGGTNGLVVVARDITEGIRAHEELGQLARRLAAQQALLQALVDSVPVGIALTRGADHRYVLANEAAERTVPAEPPLVGRTIDDVFGATPSTADLGRQIYAKVLATGEPLTLNALALPSTAPEAFEGHRYYDVTFTRVQVGEGEEGVLGVYVEVTDTVQRRVRLERELADEHQVALELQASLVPRALPEIPGVALSAVLRPAGPRTLVGGDFYDVLRWHGGRTLIVLGDVCGKGVAAARVTALVRHALRGAAVVQDDIVDLMHTMNRVLLDDRTPGSPASMSTLALVALDVDEARGTAGLEIALGGHPPPVLLDARAAYIGEPGTMLGASATPTFRRIRAQLTPGQTLLLYSDGLPDAHAPARFIDPAAMAAEHRRFADDPATLVAALRETVVSGEGEPRDDLALLAVRLTASAQQFPAAA